MFDINQLTIGQAIEIAALFGNLNSQPLKAETLSFVEPPPDPLVGQYVLVRCYSAGVHCGTLVEQKGDIVLLKDSRRLWSWKTPEGVALSGVSQFGLTTGCKVDSVSPLVRLTGCIETHVCSQAAKESIHGYK
jgi:hypothetical protein